MKKFIFSLALVIGLIAILVTPVAAEALIKVHGEGQLEGGSQFSLKAQADADYTAKGKFHFNDKAGTKIVGTFDSWGHTIIKEKGWQPLYGFRGTCLINGEPGGYLSVAIYENERSGDQKLDVVAQTTTGEDVVNIYELVIKGKIHIND
jgi:hypothetical protein